MAGRARRGGWSLAGASYPTYASGLTEGASSYPFRGTLRCSYPISRVEVRILNAAGGDAITPATASPGSKSFDLSSLDNSVAFSRLRAGGYTLVITAESGAPTDGTFRLESPFYVSGDGFTVTFDPCGGTCGEAKRAVYAGQCYGDLPTAVKDGWTFDGWYTAPEGGSRIDGADIVTAGDHTLYAHYSREYSYVFYNYDGTAVSSGRLAAGEEIPAPDQTPSRPSDGTYYYVFTGWSGYSAGMTISDNVSFTAVYEAHEIVGEPDQIITSAYVIRDGWLRRIPLGTTTAEVQSALTPSSGITIHKGQRPATGLAGTGMTVEYTRGGEVVQALTMVVTGRPQRRRPLGYQRCRAAAGQSARPRDTQRRRGAGGGRQRRRPHRYQRHGTDDRRAARAQQRQTQLTRKQVPHEILEKADFLPGSQRSRCS